MRCFLTIFLCIGCCIYCFAQAKRQPSIGTLQKKLSNVHMKRHQLKKKIQVKQRQAKVVTHDIQALDGKLTNVEVKLQRTKKNLGENRVEQAHLAKKLDHTKSLFEQKKELVRMRLRRIYIQKDNPIWFSLLRSHNLGQLASRKKVLQKIASKDKEIFTEYKDIYQEVAKNKSQKDQQVIHISGLIKKQKCEHDSLAGLKSEKQLTLSQLRHEQALLQEQLDLLERESRAISTRIRRYLASSKKLGRCEKIYKGAFIRPVRGEIVSRYGMRFHPILKVRRMHTGIDICAAHGTPIVAAGPGFVVEAGYTRGYGNKIILDHGGGLMTLYAHCSDLGVWEGQRVRRGQYIGAVGSTGLATGPHLHLEVRINGQHVDPSDYF